MRQFVEPFILKPFSVSDETWLDTGGGIAQHLAELL